MASLCRMASLQGSEVGPGFSGTHNIGNIENHNDVKTIFFLTRPRTPEFQWLKGDGQLFSSYFIENGV